MRMIPRKQRARIREAYDDTMQALKEARLAARKLERLTRRLVDDLDDFDSEGWTDEELDAYFEVVRIFAETHNDTEDLLGRLQLDDSYERLYSFEVAFPDV